MRPPWPGGSRKVGSSSTSGRKGSNAGAIFGAASRGWAVTPESAQVPAAIVALFALAASLLIDSLFRFI